MQFSYENEQFNPGFTYFLPYHFFLHRLENRMKPISTPYDGRRWWDLNLRTPACKSPALPLCYRCMFKPYLRKQVVATKVARISRPLSVSKDTIFSVKNKFVQV